MKTFAILLALVFFFQSGCQGQNTQLDKTDSNQTSSETDMPMRPDARVTEDVEGNAKVNPSKSANKKLGDSRSLPELMRANDLTYGITDLPEFIKSKIEPSKRGHLDGRFVIPEIPVYLLPGFIENEISVKAVLPFRLYKSESVLVSEKTKGLKGVSIMTVNRANIRDLWFMTKENTLAQCTPREAQLVVSRNGMLFYGEAKTTELIFGGILSDSFREDLEALPYNSFDPKGDRSKAIAEVEIEKLTFGPALEWQESWGYYRRDAMMENDRDSDFIVNWNTTGALTGTTPDYFRPSKSQNPNVVSAKLIRATLKTPGGEIIAEYKLKR